MEPIFAQGQVWYAYIPYTDGPDFITEETGKYRPVVILGWSKHGPTEDGNFVVVPITSFSDSHEGKVRKGDIEISNLRKAGLERNKPSFIRARRFLTINYASFDLRKGIRQGVISDDELDAIIDELSDMIDPDPRTIDTFY